MKCDIHQTTNGRMIFILAVKIEKKKILILSKFNVKSFNLILLKRAKVKESKKSLISKFVPSKTNFSKISFKMILDNNFVSFVFES